MAKIERINVENLLDRYKELGNDVFSIRENMEARLGGDFWDIPLNSRTILLYGKMDDDGRRHFKIDHNFNLNTIINNSLNEDNRISIDREIYDKSSGAEFIILKDEDIISGEKSTKHRLYDRLPKKLKLIVSRFIRHSKKQPEKEYAIRASNYKDIKAQLDKGPIELDYLIENGGFRINKAIEPEDAKTHDGWLELAVGKNDTVAEDYTKAAAFLEGYISKAQEMNCFTVGVGGMAFYLPTKKENLDFTVSKWNIGCSTSGSCASATNFSSSTYGNYFLKKRQ